MTFSVLSPNGVALGNRIRRSSKTRKTKGFSFQFPTSDHYIQHPSHRLLTTEVVAYLETIGVLFVKEANSFANGSLVGLLELTSFECLVKTVCIGQLTVFSEESRFQSGSDLVLSSS